MPYATSRGAKLYYEEAGKGVPIVFVHEFSGDLRSWETQLRHFSRRYRCVAFNARGYPPSEVPSSRSRYSHNQAADDIAALEHEHLQAGLGEVGRANEAVVAGADQDRIVFSGVHGRIMRQRRMSRVGALHFLLSSHRKLGCDSQASANAERRPEGRSANATINPFALFPP